MEKEKIIIDRSIWSDLCYYWSTEAITELRERYTIIITD